MLVSTNTTVSPVTSPSTTNQSASGAPPAIAVHGVSKMYRIYDRPQDRLKQMLWRGHRQYGREFWALRDVSFNVAKGETVGIIGRNGSGKSTLLQIIAGTLTPSEGEVTVNGRVAALLELGSGFNPEFTGRENVFLNGAILGISRVEMEARFDTIAAFADIGEFIEQPVKIYSSGMLLRLAFAVAINVDADILIVDEALAVGDFAFQHKCISRLSEIRARGASVLLVTHSLGAVQANCQRAILMEHGQMVAVGDASEVCDRYYQSMIEANATHDREQQRVALHNGGVPKDLRASSSNTLGLSLQAAEPSARWGRGGLTIIEWGMFTQDGIATDTFSFRDHIQLVLRVIASEDSDRCFPGFVVRDRNGYHLTGITNRTCNVEIEHITAGEELLLTFDIELLYREDNYSILLNIATDEIGTDFYDVCENIGNFTIVADPIDQPRYGYGRVYLPTKLQVYRLPKEAKA